MGDGKNRGFKGFSWLMGKTADLENRSALQRAQRFDPTSGFSWVMGRTADLENRSALQRAPRFDPIRRQAFRG